MLFGMSFGLIGGRVSVGLQKKVGALVLTSLLEDLMVFFLFFFLRGSLGARSPVIPGLKGRTFLFQPGRGSCVPGLFDHRNVKALGQRPVPSKKASWCPNI